MKALCGWCMMVNYFRLQEIPHWEVRWTFSVTSECFGPELKLKEAGELWTFVATVTPGHTGNYRFDDYHSKRRHSFNTKRNFAFMTTEFAIKKLIYFKKTYEFYFVSYLLHPALFCAVFCFKMWNLFRFLFGGGNALMM